MPRLACWSCGRQIYTVSPIESLFAEERRCPRCGAYLNVERRENERRQRLRRMNPIDEPGPPDPTVERRTTDRRTGQRRSGGSSGGSARGSSGGRTEAGWVD